MAATWPAAICLYCSHRIIRSPAGQSTLLPPPTIDVQVYVHEGYLVEVVEGLAIERGDVEEVLAVPGRFFTPMLKLGTYLLSSSLALSILAPSSNFLSALMISSISTWERNFHAL